MRARKREASLAGVRSKLRWSRQLHSQRHRRQRDQKEQQGLPARFPACSTPVIRTGRQEVSTIRRSRDEVRPRGVTSALAAAQNTARRPGRGIPPMLKPTSDKDLATANVLFLTHPILIHLTRNYLATRTGGARPATRRRCGLSRSAPATPMAGMLATKAHIPPSWRPCSEPRASMLRSLMPECLSKLRG